MIFPRFARYYEVMLNVNKFFAKERVTSFPVDPFRIIKNNKWGLVTYSDLAQDQGVWIEDIIDAFQSEDGYTIYDGSNYTIAYNDTIQNKGRIRFTLMHEIGHIYMGHLVDFDETILMRSSLTEHKYKILENEANSFARNALAPIMVVKGLNLKTVNELVDYFGISYAAAKVRLSALILDYRQLIAPFIQFQREHFKSFIHVCRNSKQCIVCSHHFVKEDAEYCPICGHKALMSKKGDGYMIYNGYILDDSSRAIVCPRCENEHLNYEGDVCKICGTNLVNRCAPTHQSDETGWVYLEDSCGTLLDGDARFCIKCGNHSTFYRQGLLEDWEKEKEQIELDELLS